MGATLSFRFSYFMLEVTQVNPRFYLNRPRIDLTPCQSSTILKEMIAYYI